LGDVVSVNLQEVIDVVVLAIHHENEVDALQGSEEPLSVVLRDPLLHMIVDQNLLVESLIVLSVALRLDAEGLLEEVVQIDLGRLLLEGESYHVIVSLLQKLQRVLVPQLN
jgi:hypothetical protein